ncbi:hypothetical protein EJB05_32090, partial [Eragrostis curvula]
MEMKPSSLSKPLLAFFFLLLRKLAGRRHRSRMAAATTKPSPPPPPLDKLHGKTLVVDVEGWILRPPVSAFPYFMLETFAVGEADTRGWRQLPRDEYPRPLVFHDGRLAFAPTPPAALAMYTFLPFAVALVAFRILAFSFLPYRVCFPVGALTGVHYRLVAGGGHASKQQEDGGGGGRLYPGAKWMDPFYFMMNPRPAYRVEFLPCAGTAAAEDDGGRREDSIDVANRVQRELGKALGFQLTGLTRKDKYMMLAGNEGVVPAASNNN